jgi:uncharacterized repeat protein (TIGR03803 family)
MRRSTILSSINILGLACWLLSTSVSAHGTVIANFPIGAGPYGNVEPDGSGSLYGTAVYLNGNGGIYRLKKKAGGWNYQVLHSFDTSEGTNPYAGLTRNPDTGELYGTANSGGPNQDGTVFSFMPSDNGGTLTVLHSFSGQDGALISTGLLRDKQTGTLYGTSEYGGKYGCGTVYALTPSGGSWSFTTLYEFRSDVDGCFPQTQVHFGPEPGTLIGATLYGYSGAGSIYELALKSGTWTKTTLYSLQPGTDGSDPTDIAVSQDGAIYGLAEEGGGQTVVFQLALQHNKWAYRIIDDLASKASGPGGIYLDNTGTIYGATKFGGVLNHGLLFKLVPMGHSWTETVFQKFKDTERNGGRPTSRPVIDSQSGALYLVTTLGGANGGGTVYSVP